MSASPTKRRCQTKILDEERSTPTGNRNLKVSPTDHFSSVPTCPLSRLLGRSFRISSVGVVRAFEDLERPCSRYALVWILFTWRCMNRVAGLRCTMLRADCLLPSASSYERMAASPSTYTRVLVEQETISIRLQLLSVCNHNPKMRCAHR
jgi:hypothetical protein